MRRLSRAPFADKRAGVSGLSACAAALCVDRSGICVELGLECMKARVSAVHEMWTDFLAGFGVLCAVDRTSWQTDWLCNFLKVIAAFCAS